jgi:PIN like domain
VKVLIDHNISHRVAHAIAILAEPNGHQVFAKSDLFDTAVSVPDVEWLTTLAEEGTGGRSFPTTIVSTKIPKNGLQWCPPG